MTQIYQNNSPIFIKVLNKKGVVKDYDSTLDQYYITYFNSKDKRESNWFTTSQLNQFKSKEIHASSSNGEKLVRFDNGEMILPLNNQSNSLINNLKKENKISNHVLRELYNIENESNPSPKMLYSDIKETQEWYDKYINDGKCRTEYELWIIDKIKKIVDTNHTIGYKNLHTLEYKKELMDYVKSGCPLFKGHKMNYVINKNNVQKTLPDGRLLYWTDKHENQYTTSPTIYPVIENDEKVKFDIPKDIPQATPDINNFTEMLASSYNFKEMDDLLKEKVGENEENLKGEELIKRVERLLQEWDNLKPFKFKYDEQLEFPVTNNQYDNHIKSLEKLIEGYKLVLSKNNTPLSIKIKYFSDINPVEKIDKGNWIDLRSAVDIEIKQGERAMIPLGVGMKLPEGYEANVVPRSSTFKTWGIIQTNHYGVIDNSYSGNDDQWHMPVYATRDTKINKNDRICQFRINEIQPKINIEVVENLDETSRSGFGSTGTN